MSAASIEIQPYHKLTDSLGFVTGSEANYNNPMRILLPLYKFIFLLAMIFASLLKASFTEGREEKFVVK